MKSIRNNWINFMASLGLAIVLFSGLQYAARGVFADPDGFYHAKASQLLAKGNLHDTFPWLYYTTWNQYYADQHYLYHWFLVPFNTIERLPVSVILLSLVFITLFLLTLQKYKIKYLILWTVLLLGSSADFLFRVNLVKANTLSLALLLMIVILIHSYHFSVSGKARALVLFGVALISGVFVWTYGGFVCVPFLLALYFGVESLSATLSYSALNFSKILQSILPFLVSLIGIVIGMILHPQSNHILSLILDQLFRTGLGAGTNVPAGNEWKTFDLIWFVQSNALILIAWLFSLVVVILQLKNDFRNILSGRGFALIIWLQLTSIGLLVLTLWHRRFVEYWVPLAVLTSAVTLHPYLKKITFLKFKEALQYWQMKVAVILLLGVSVFAIYYNINYVYGSLTNNDSVSSFQASSNWLMNNSQKGDIVFNTQWDVFPELFYYNDKDYYVVGLDPTFMYIKNPDLYWQWRKIADDGLGDWQNVQQVHDTLTNLFNAKYLFLDMDKNKELVNYIDTDMAAQYFTKGYEDAKVVIFKIK